MTIISPLLRGLCDDAALFPPGNALLAEAIPAHAAYLQADYDALVGPFVFPAPRLSELAAYVSADSPVTLSLTVLSKPIRYGGRTLERARHPWCSRRRRRGGNS